MGEFSCEEEMYNEGYCNGYNSAKASQATTIAALQSEIARMRKTLEPFANRVALADQNAERMGYAPSFDDYRTSWTFSFGELRAARAALSAPDVTRREE
jgi:hypothetical protein